LVIGHDNSEFGLRARQLMADLYSMFETEGRKIYWMDVRSAEFTKYAANAMLATRISFMNELANLADLLGVDIEAVRHGIGSDPRIGPSFLMAGCGYGGSCFPKDVQALSRTAQEHGQHLRILQAVEDVNEGQKHVLAKKVFAKFGDNLQGKHFALWGLAFKPDTDDMRAASSRVLIKELLNAGATIAAFDPVSMVEAKRVLALDFADDPTKLKQISFVELPNKALLEADALIIVTEWPIFRNANVGEIKQYLKQACVFDGRNLYDPIKMIHAGLEYHAIGRAVLTQN
jgi:UDPglucose 6-dehydrogenase